MFFFNDKSKLWEKERKKESQHLMLSQSWAIEWKSLMIQTVVHRHLLAALISNTVFLFSQMISNFVLSFAHFFVFFWCFGCYVASWMNLFTRMCPRSRRRREKSTRNKSQNRQFVNFHREHFSSLIFISKVNELATSASANYFHRLRQTQRRKELNCRRISLATEPRLLLEIKNAIKDSKFKSDYGSTKHSRRKTRLVFQELA